MFNGDRVSFLLGLLVDLGKGVFDDWKSKREQARAIDKAIADNKVRLAQSTTEFNQAWEMAALQGRDDTLRRISFAIWVTPFVWGGISPATLRAYFETLGQVLPDWYVTGFLAMNAAIWGITSLKNVRGAFTTVPTAPLDAGARETMVEVK